MRKTIAIYGAIDRMNYGDLLFPLILKNAYGSDNRDVQLEYFGVIESDLTQYGAFKSRPARELFDPSIIPDGSSIIIAGGETLSCDWVDAHYYLEGRFALWQRILRRMAGRLMLNQAIGRTHGTTAQMPYVPAHRHFKSQVKIGHNAVGGSNLIAKPQIANLVFADLFDSDYVSIRDKWTRDIIIAAKAASQHKTPVEMSPDSAVLMSEYYSREQLSELVTDEASKIISDYKPGHYFCLQVKYSLGQKSVDEIAQQVSLINRELGLPCVLLPIGRAEGHSDQLLLSRLREKISTPVVMPEKNTLFDTMAIIANSAVFAGTSLHGAITAISFGVPHFALSARDLKVPSFLDTWDVDQQRVIRRFDEMGKGVQSVLQIPSSVLKENSNRVITCAYDGLCALSASLDLPKPRANNGPALGQ